MKTKINFPLYCILTIVFVSCCGRLPKESVGGLPRVNAVPVDTSGIWSSHFLVDKFKDPTTHPYLISQDIKNQKGNDIMCFRLSTSNKGNISVVLFTTMRFYNTKVPVKFTINDDKPIVLSFEEDVRNYGYGDLCYTGEELLPIILCLSDGNDVLIKIHSDWDDSIYDSVIPAAGFKEAYAKFYSDQIAWEKEMDLKKK